jgi:hypothetical protein
LDGGSKGLTNHSKLKIDFPWVRATNRHPGGRKFVSGILNHILMIVTAFTSFISLLIATLKFLDRVPRIFDQSFQALRI